VLTGIQAQAIGLVDHIGYLDDAVVRARQLAGLPESAPVVMLRRDNDRAYTMLDMTPNSPTMSSVIPLKVPGLDRSLLPTYLYLWQPEPLPQ
jgi:protease-4